MKSYVLRGMEEKKDTQERQDDRTNHHPNQPRRNNPKRNSTFTKSVVSCQQEKKS